MCAGLASGKRPDLPSTPSAGRLPDYRLPGQEPVKSLAL